MIVIGTAGYGYDDWVGPFYPKGLDKREWLAFYGERFSFTEVNATFYRMPNRFMLSRMEEKTPAGFRFSIKAYRGISHDRNNLGEDCQELIKAVEPLAEKGKLACIMVQFPNSYRNKLENRRYLADMAKKLNMHPVVVEFRHQSWAQSAVFAYLENLGLGYVCVDEPRLPTLMPPVVKATSGIAYVRFHGRNYEKWWNAKEAYERYDYLYSQAELMEWIPKLEALEREADTVYVAMNNHYQGQAAQNGKMLREMLGKDRR
ncbi:MAG: DUF72 domain-containing protein [Firmicutes bacterium]|nr:DUF72 domain-containing protein [Bacillota bacterium]